MVYRSKICSLQQGTKGTDWFMDGKWQVLKVQPKTGALPGKNLRDPFIKAAKISNKLSPDLWACPEYCRLFISQEINSQDDVYYCDIITDKTCFTFLFLFQCQVRQCFFSKSFKRPFHIRAAVFIYRIVLIQCQLLLNAV